MATEQPTREQMLEGALRTLMRGYVNVLENGRNRILDLGGQCDPVDKMEAADSCLREARKALAYGVAASQSPRMECRLRMRYCQCGPLFEGECPNKVPVDGTPGVPASRSEPIPPRGNDGGEHA